jgi:predicted DNA-binding ribbon-helix-helix protein
MPTCTIEMLWACSIWTTTTSKRRSGVKRSATCECSPSRSFFMKRRSIELRREMAPCRLIADVQTKKGQLLEIEERLSGLESELKKARMRAS